MNRGKKKENGNHGETRERMKESRKRGKEETIYPTVLAHQSLTPDEPLSVRTHSTAQRYPCNPHAGNKRERKEETLWTKVRQHL